MPKILFIQREKEDKLGPMVLAGYLKSFGFEAEILIDPVKHIKEIKRINPEFIGISVLTPSEPWALSISKFIKKELPGTLVILGGPHPTFFPDVIEQPGIDIVCVGEGEKPLLQLLRNYDGSISSIKNIPNLWVKDGKEVMKNDVGMLLSGEELSNLPFCDRSYYSKYPFLKKNPHKKIWTSRGCPYNCSYCFNHAYKKIYEGRGQTVRQRSVDSLILELKELKKAGWECLEIVDDQFLLSPDWIMDFCGRYKKEIGLPFACFTTAKQIKAEVVKELSGAGCKTIAFAIETGVEKIRKEIYKKPVTNEDIIKAAEILHANNVPFLTFNMIGVPGESIADIYETIKLNQQIGTTYPWCSILQPFPGTEIAELFSKKGGDAAPKFSYSYFQSSLIGDTSSKRIVTNAQRLFAHFVKSKTSYDDFARYVARPRFGIDKLYPLMFYWHYGRDIRKRYGLSWFALFRYWLYSKS